MSIKKNMCLVDSVFLCFKCGKYSNVCVCVLCVNVFVLLCMFYCLYAGVFVCGCDDDDDGDD